MRGEPETPILSGVTGSQRVTSERVELEIFTEAVTKINAASVPNINPQVPEISWQRLKNHWAHLAGLPLRESGGRVCILLGLDHANLMLIKEYREKSRPEEPCVIKTRLGWVVQGVMNPRKNMYHGRVNFLQQDEPRLDHLF